jgi:hypothetical protein
MIEHENDLNMKKRMKIMIINLLGRHAFMLRSSSENENIIEQNKGDVDGE